MPATAIPSEFNYIGRVYRPPQEADAILLQATVGCSHGKCTFCQGYRTRPFSLKDQQVLEADLRFAHHYCLRQDRVFVLDGNALCMPVARWEWLLENIRTQLPWVTGVGAFGTAKDIEAKTDEELSRLCSLGLNRLYVGVESGHDGVLAAVQKGVTSATLQTQCKRVKAAGMNLRVSVLLGIAEPAVSEAHATATGLLLSAVTPDETAVLSLVRERGTPIDKAMKAGELQPLSPHEIVAELRCLLQACTMQNGVFDCRHASNYVHFCVDMPEQKQTALALLDAALQGDVALVPDMWRRV